MSNFTNEYLSWLRNCIKEKKLDNCVEITTPFLDRHNDWMQVYVEQLENGKIRITDDGYILKDLMASGIDMKSNSRKKILNTLTNGYEVTVSEDDELCITTERHLFAQKQHMLIQCMLSVSDMYMTSKSNAFSVFSEEIKDFFEKHDICYSPDIYLHGKSGFKNKFDYLVPHNKKRPEILVKGINNPSADKIKLALFQWEDTKEVRDVNTKLLLYLNDSKNISDEILQSCRSYGIQAFPWKVRDDSLNLVA